MNTTNNYNTTTVTAAAAGAAPSANAATGRIEEDVSLDAAAAAPSNDINNNNNNSNPRKHPRAGTTAPSSSAASLDPNNNNNINNNHNAIVEEDDVDDDLEETPSKKQALSWPSEDEEAAEIEGPEAEAEDRTTWTDAMVASLVTAYCNEYRRSKGVENSKNISWKSIGALLHLSSEKCRQKFNKTIKRAYKIFNAFAEHQINGVPVVRVRYDENGLAYIDAEPHIIDQYIKENPTAKKFKHQPFKYGYQELHDCFSKSFNFSSTTAGDAVATAAGTKESGSGSSLLNGDTLLQPVLTSPIMAATSSTIPSSPIGAASSTSSIPSSSGTLAPFTPTKSRSGGVRQTSATRTLASRSPHVAISPRTKAVSKFLQSTFLKGDDRIKALRKFADMDLVDIVLGTFEAEEDASTMDGLVLSWEEKK